MRKLDAVALLLCLPVALIILSALSGNPASGSSPQNANSSTTTNKSAPETRQVPPPSKAPSGGGGGAREDFSKNTWQLPEDADKTKNPVAATEESVAKGKELYLDRAKGNCNFCHGDDGKGNAAMLPNLRRKPADISNKETMSAMTDGEVFWKISKGIQGIMPSGDRKMTEEERWHVVNYVRTLAKK